MIRIYSDDTPEDVIDKLSAALADHGLEIVYATPPDTDDHVVIEVVEYGSTGEDDDE